MPAADSLLLDGRQGVAVYVPTVMLLALDNERRLDLERAASQRSRLVSRQRRSLLSFARRAWLSGAQAQLVAAAGARL